MGYPSPHLKTSRAGVRAIGKVNEAAEPCELQAPELRCGWIGGGSVSRRSWSTERERPAFRSLFSFLQLHFQLPRSYAACR
jgi:hypothetical protein